MTSFLSVLFLVMLAAAPAAASEPCHAGAVTGRVSYVRDGDTIELGSMAIRLSGLAAPEWDEPGGKEAREAMIELVHGRQVRCELDGTRTYDRSAGICYLNGRDVAEAMVSAGLARDCSHYSGGRYRAAELQAAVVGATIGQSYELPGYCH
jgi:endonuclease YncB( thermonuclease family)